MRPVQDKEPHLCGVFGGGEALFLSRLHLGAVSVVDTAMSGPNAAVGLRIPVCIWRGPQPPSECWEQREQSTAMQSTAAALAP